jgi:hypothetical protein
MLLFHTHRIFDNPGSATNLFHMCVAICKGGASSVGYFDQVGGEILMSVCEYLVSGFLILRIMNVFNTL